MDGAYRIPTDHVRAWAIQCHALDLQFDQLFNQETICGFSERIYEAYNRLFSIALLNLAISIRVSLKSEKEYTSLETGISACGLFEDSGPEWWRKRLEKQSGRFSFKDVCDKLIHAHEIHKPIEQGGRGAGCRLLGTHENEQWEFGLGVQIFCEYVLKWLDEIDDRAPRARRGQES